MENSHTQQNWIDLSLPHNLLHSQSFLSLLTTPFLLFIRGQNFWNHMWILSFSYICNLSVRKSDGFYLSLCLESDYLSLPPPLLPPSPLDYCQQSPNGLPTILDWLFMKIQPEILLKLKSDHATSQFRTLQLLTFHSNWKTNPYTGIYNPSLCSHFLLHFLTCLLSQPPVPAYIYFHTNHIITLIILNIF